MLSARSSFVSIPGQTYPIGDMNPDRSGRLSTPERSDRVAEPSRMDCGTASLADRSRPSCCRRVADIETARSEGSAGTASLATVAALYRPALGSVAPPCCEWVVLVVLVRFDEPVTGPSPWSPEVLPRVFYRAARRSDAHRACRPGNRAFAGSCARRGSQA
jgi:hypothetical protein